VEEEEEEDDEDAEEDEEEEEGMEMFGLDRRTKLSRWFSNACTPYPYPSSNILRSTDTEGTSVSESNAPRRTRSVLRGPDLFEEEEEQEEESDTDEHDVEEVELLSSFSSSASSCSTFSWSL
jgi:hypothetical protein